MCSSCNKCFSDEEKNKLINLGWSKEQIEFAENTIIEEKIKEMI